MVSRRTELTGHGAPFLGSKMAVQGSETGSFGIRFLILSATWFGPTPGESATVGRQWGCGGESRGRQRRENQGSHVMSSAIIGHQDSVLLRPPYVKHQGRKPRRPWLGMTVGSRPEQAPRHVFWFLCPRRRQRGVRVVQSRTTGNRCLEPTLSGNCTLVR